MKSEPDRVDFLIVLLPVLLIGLLSFQVYQYFQVDHDLVLDAVAAVSPAPDAGPGEPRGASTPPEPAETSGGAQAEPPATDPVPEGDLPVPEGGAPAPEGEPAEVAVDEEAQGPDAGDEVAAGDVPAGEPSAPEVPGDAGDPAADAAGAEVAPAPAGIVPAVDAVPSGITPPGTMEPGADPADPYALTQIAAVPRTNPVAVGDEVALDILIRNARDAASVIFHLGINKNILKFENHKELGPFLEDERGFNRFVATAVPTGKVIVAITNPTGEGRSGDGILATFYFRALAPGVSELSFQQQSVRTPTNQLIDSEFLAEPIEVQ